MPRPDYRVLTVVANVIAWDIPFEVQYEYHPEEPRTQDHPGSPAEACLIAAKVGGVDILDVLDDDQQQHLERIVLDAL